MGWGGGREGEREREIKVFVSAINENKMTNHLTKLLETGRMTYLNPFCLLLVLLPKRTFESFSPARVLHVTDAHTKHEWKLFVQFMPQNECMFVFHSNKYII